MQDNDLDKTRAMTPEEQERMAQALAEDEEQDFSRPRGTVRELKRERIRPSAPKGTGKGKKAALLLGVFVLALLLGFFIAGATSDRVDEKESQQAATEASLASREDKLAKEEKNLREQRASLQEEMKKLEERERALTEESGRLQGEGEGLKEKNSGLTGILDKVTGKEKERQEKGAQNEAASAKAATDTEAVREKIAEAQQALTELDARMEDLQTMQEELATVKGKAEAAYEENKDTIDTVVYYIRAGALRLTDFIDTMGKL